MLETTRMKNQLPTNRFLLRDPDDYHSVLDQVNVAIFCTDTDGKIYFLNRPAAQLFATHRSPFPVSDIRDLVVPGGETDVMDQIAQLIVGDTPFEFDSRMVSQSGEEDWFRVSLSGHKDDRGNIRSLIGVMNEASEIKKVEDILKQKEEQLEQLKVEKREFIGIASHELKTPVTSIKAYAEIIKERLSETGDHLNGQFIIGLNRQIDRLTELIRYLIDSSHISEGVISLTLEKVDLKQLLIEKVDEFKRMSTHSFDLLLEEVPMVIADRDRITQVIVNLIGNAIKYSPSQTRVTIKSRARIRGVEISIKDEGWGIDPAHHEKIFERFYRVRNEEKDNGPGMGLGLYISSQILRKHGGSIRVRSATGQGSEFKFFIPYHYNINQNEKNIGD